MQNYCRHTLMAVCVALLFSVLFLTGCEPERVIIQDERASGTPVIIEMTDWVPATRGIDYADGTYRGVFSDGGNDQVNVQFTIENNILTAARYRHLWYGGNDFLSTEDETLQGITTQHTAVLDALIGEDIRVSPRLLYHPASLIGDDHDIDGFTGATIRGNKIAHAIRDGLTRGVYSFSDVLPEHYYPLTGSSFQDGRYRGTFSDQGNMQVNVQLTLENNIVTATGYRYLWYRDQDYRSSEDATIVGLRIQYEALLESLVGQDIRTAMRAMYDPGNLVGAEYDIDGFSGATLRSNKVISAVRDALNRGVYSFAGEIPPGYRNIAQESFEDGRYRGTFSDGGEMQVNVQFDLENNIVSNTRFRALAYRGTDFRSAEENPIAGIAEQHVAALSALEGSDVRGTLALLYQPVLLIGSEYDIDGFTGATIRGTKIRAAIRDALNRGPYSLP